MRRRLFTILSAISLVLWLQIFAMTLRSHSHAMSFSIPLGKGFQYGVAFEKGCVCIAIDTSITRQGPLIEYQSRAQIELWTNPTWFITCGADHSYFEPWTKGGGYSELITRYCIVSAWVLLVITAILPLIWLDRRVRRGTRRRTGLCASCGYDLRASFGRCPECGALPSGR